ncbi:MAG: ABC transporter permease [Acidimicrobiia bacterium]|nr:ABC transporter permease [Acidimicrobiia bacterium]
MLKYIAKRIVQMFFVFIVFLTLTFFLLQALPGDIVSQKLAGNPNLPAEARQIALARLGLDRPLWEQYTSYLVNFFQGDLGFSYSQYPRPVVDIIAERLPRTIVLFFTAIVLIYWTGFMTGKYLAWRRNQRGEMAITIGGVGLYTVFYPWFAILLIWIFGVKMKLLPINQFINPQKWTQAPYRANEVFTWITVSVAALLVFLFLVALVARRMPDRRAERLVRWPGIIVGFGVFAWWWLTSPAYEFGVDIATHMILPVMTLTLIGFAGIMLLTRSSMLETMKEDYILTARAKGLPESKVRDKHAARTALLPVTTSLVLAIASVIDGGVITETVFSWPGMGEILVTSVVLEDVPLALAAFSFVGLMAVVGHLVSDILYGFLDPRIRVQAQG